MQSETVGELTKALIKAQSDYPVIPKTKKGTIPTKTGGSYSYNYADLPDIKTAIDPILWRNGLCVSQPTGPSSLRSVLLHESGEWIDAELDLFLAQQTPQGQGSAITYARRYIYCALTGVVADEDDDGASATHTTYKARVTGRTVEDAFPGATEEPRPSHTGPISDKQWSYFVKLATAAGDTLRERDTYGVAECSKAIDGYLNK